MPDLKPYQSEWKPIEGWPYSVSDDGHVRNDRTGHILKMHEMNRGYLDVLLCNNGISQNKTVHRLVAEAFIPNPECKPQVNHKDGNKKNNYVSNLEWVTNSENQLHCCHVLGKMPCEPVYIVAGYVSWWDIVSFAGMEYLYLKVEGSLPFRDYGKNWTAYRQMPEEGTV